MSGTVPNNIMANSIVAQSFAFLAIMLTMPQLVGWLMMRTRTLAHEAMLPVDRRSYVRQLIAAVAASYFQLCGVVLASAFLWCLVPVVTPPPLAFVASLAAAVLLTQICQFGVMVFAYTITSLRTMHGMALVFMVLMIGSMWFGSILLIGSGASTDNSQLLPEVLPIAAGLAALGVLLAYIAYRRWLAADFD